MDFSLFKPNLINMNVHSATCSCSDELYKQWYTLADFLPSWDISRGFLDVSITSEHSGKIHINTLIFCAVFSLYYLPEGSAELRWAGRGSGDTIR